MTLKRQTFNNGTEGAEITVANSSTSGDAIGNITKAGTGMGVYRSVANLRGAKGAYVTGILNDTFGIDLTDTAAPSASAQLYFRLLAIPTASGAFFRLRSSTGNVAIFIISTTGSLQLQNSAGTSIKNFNSNSPLTLNTTYRVQLQATPDATGTAGFIAGQLYDDSNNLLDSYSSNAVNAGTTTDVTSVSAGKVVVGSDNFAMHIDELAFDSGNAGEIPPVPKAQPPTLIATYSSVYTSSLATKTVTVTTEPGDYVVVYAAITSGGSNLTLPVGNGILFGLLQGPVGKSTAESSWAPEFIWGGFDTFGGTSWTLSVANASGSYQWGFTCLVFRGSVGPGTVVSSRGTSSTPQLNITTTKEASALVFCSTDKAAGNGARTWLSTDNITPASGSGEITYSTTASQMTVYGACYSNVATVGTKTIGLSAPGSQNWIASAVEIRGLPNTGAGIMWSASNSTLPAGYKQNTAEGQPNGTTLSAANSGGGSGDAFGSVNAAGSVATFSSDVSLGGTNSYKIVSGSSSAVTLIYGGGGEMSGACKMYVYLPSYPDNFQNVMIMYSTTPARVAGLSITQTGTIVVYDAAASAITASVDTIPLNTWVRLDLAATIGATSTSGRITASASYGYNASPFWWYESGPTANTGTVGIATYRFGKLDVVPNLPTFYIDELGCAPNMTSLLPVATA